jgi:hypothetical protein
MSETMCAITESQYFVNIDQVLVVESSIWILAEQCSAHLWNHLNECPCVRVPTHTFRLSSSSRLSSVDTTRIFD